MWVYPFLDWSKGVQAALMYIVVGTIFTLVFFIMVGIHDLRDWIAQMVHRAPRERISPRSMEWMALPQYDDQSALDRNVSYGEPSMTSMQQIH